MTLRADHRPARRRRYLNTVWQENLSIIGVTLLLGVGVYAIVLAWFSG